ncbi:a64419c4-908b-4e83-b4b8-28d42b769a1d [Thermothielavioides terrestris]|uniref:Uncharacterized protein n=2 Tax=Thermothielavioides terrestris TaxID=2587410 RepID=G2R621_THETT|nr:uncharacterized protein THITE_2144886 [Thermothielavioides terrestris NRRL 8126]AEO67558.1 hypothetical protein THITE_2144886 [Thermothielavioides terrestris NRRL 8126]SPQ25688.1 a64419c4-908b-4e83-b4b8-28d42b769a1d [Thermothielavioides terrestris]
MSGAATSVAANHFRGALSRWPKAVLRPELQLRDVLARRLEQGRPLAPATARRGAAATQEQADLRQANALCSLLENRYQNKYRAPPSIFEPKSNPTYYKDLLKELEEAPHRSWLGRIAKRLGGMIRFS